MHQTLHIELIDDAVFSARSATEGGHASLDRIPGAALLGAAAAKLYTKLDAKSAFAFFHSGQLRFGDGLPFDGHAIAYPVPLCWHHAKSLQPNQAQRLDKGLIYNFQHCDRIDAPAGTAEPQPKQLRTGYVQPADGTWIRPDHGLRLKTAIDPQTGRAAEGQLFGYDALARGQTFAARIEADDDLDPALVQQVIDALTGPLLLGRSRSAEYGRAEARPIELNPPMVGPRQGDQLTVWLLSDLALADQSGQPTLTPDAHSLGLPDAKLLHTKTFLRARRWSPWNAARHGYDRERLVLSAGGVITLELKRDLTPDEAARLPAGIGLHREAGLGRVWVNPPVLADKHPDFAVTNETADSRSANEQQRPNDPLIAWLEAQAGDWKTEAERAALRLADDYLRLLQRARKLAGIAPELSFGPSKSQWGRVLEAARERDGQALFDTLFSGKSAVIKRDGKGWEEEVPVQTGNWQHLADWLKDKLADGGDQPGFAHQVRRLAHRVRDDIDKRRV